MWRASVLTIFPDMFPGPLGLSLAGRALAAGLWALDAIDIRVHALDKHRSVDDTPAGGGPGMVMKADVLARAIDAASAGHAGPPTGRGIVDGAVLVGRMVANVDRVERPHALLQRLTGKAQPKGPRKHLGKNREDGCAPHGVA